MRQPGNEVPRVMLLGRSWRTRGGIYWLRRVFLSFLFSFSLVIVSIMAAAVFSAASGIASPAWRYMINGVLSAVLVCGLGYGYLVFRVNTAKKRPDRGALDQSRIELLTAVNARLNGRVGRVFAKLTWAPLFLLSPALFLGAFIALALGSFQRYFSVQEFETVQQFSRRTA